MKSRGKLLPMSVVTEPDAVDASVTTEPLRPKEPVLSAVNRMVQSWYTVDATPDVGLPPKRITPGGLFSVDRNWPPGQSLPTTTSKT